ncbi:hypothetical protein E5S67_05025 [Microcoleus sp. IPMA8]|uniref:Uncharacterized protein n=1 Tax=Microcoleus asticus IPMA8 TaxID=2563858 RepID=A0ABX2D3N3_9CYAN|nr:hypothetical protein [Microcoleus asticus IPMA8]
MTNDMMSDKLTIIRFVLTNPFLFVIRTQALTTNKFYSYTTTGCDRNDESIRQQDPNLPVKKS